MMEDNNIIEMIKKQDTVNALDKMEELFKEILLKKIDEKEKNEINNDFMNILEFCIKKFPEDYEVLTYLRNLYFFNDRSDKEKLYELAYIYEALTEI